MMRSNLWVRGAGIAYTPMFFLNLIRPKGFAGVTKQTKDMKRIITLIVITTLLCGCYATKMAEVMQSYMGHTKGTVIRNFGPPSSVAPDGNGGEVLIYATQSTIYTPPGGYPSGVPQHNRVYWNYKMFYIGKDNCVYHWRLEKMEIPPQQVYLYLR